MLRALLAASLFVKGFGEENGSSAATSAVPEEKWKTVLDAKTVADEARFKAVEAQVAELRAVIAELQRNRAREEGTRSKAGSAEATPEEPEEQEQESKPSKEPRRLSEEPRAFAELVFCPPEMDQEAGLCPKVRATRVNGDSVSSNMTMGVPVGTLTLRCRLVTLLGSIKRN